MFVAVYDFRAFEERGASRRDILSFFQRNNSSGNPQLQRGKRVGGFPGVPYLSRHPAEDPTTICRGRLFIAHVGVFLIINKMANWHATAGGAWPQVAMPDVNNMVSFSFFFHPILLSPIILSLPYSN